MSDIYTLMIFFGSLAYIGLGVFIVHKVRSLPFYARVLLIAYCFLKGVVRGFAVILVILSGSFAVSDNVSGLALFTTVSDAAILWVLFVGLLYHYYLRKSDKNNGDERKRVQ